jgi:uncharacterized membrane protein
MSEPAEVLPPLDPASPGGPNAPGSGLPENVAAGLASLLTLPSGLVFFLLDRRSAFVRFYAIQGIVLGSVLLLFGIATMVVNFFVSFVVPIKFIGPLIHWVVGFVLAVVWLIWTTIWIISTINAFRGKRWAIPFLSTVLHQYNPPGR